MVNKSGHDYKKLYSTHNEMGGGVHLDLIHEIDYCYWLFGNPYSVMSLKRHVSSLQINSVDFAAYHLLYPDHTVNVILNYYRKTKKREIEIVTEEGVLHADLSKAMVTIYGNHISIKDTFSIEETYEHQMKYFLDHITNGKQPMNGFAEALNVLKIVLN